MCWKLVRVTGGDVEYEECIDVVEVDGIFSMMRTHCIDSSLATARLLKPCGIRDKEAAYSGEKGWFA
jgi:hypothetical protein